MYTWDAADRLTSVDGVTYTYDDNGSLLSDGTYSYSYDTANRLTQVVSGTFTTEYVYNGDGVRVAQIAGGLRTDYVQDAAVPLPQVLTARQGDTVTRYLRGLGLVGEQRGTGPAAWQYHLPDALGSIRQVADPGGQVILSQAYDPFGNLIQRSAVGGQPSAYGFAGEEQDPASGLVHLRARTYNPATGRFLQADPVPGIVSQPRSLHRYAYAFNNPVNYVDPSGNRPASGRAPAPVSYNRSFSDLPSNGGSDGLVGGARRSAYKMAQGFGNWASHSSPFARQQSQGMRPRRCGTGEILNELFDAARRGQLLPAMAGLEKRLENFLATAMTAPTYLPAFLAAYGAQVWWNTRQGMRLTDALHNVSLGQTWGLTQAIVGPVWQFNKRLISEVGAARFLMGAAVITTAVVVTGGAAIPAIALGAVIGAGIGYGAQVWGNYGQGLRGRDMFLADIDPVMIAKGAFLGAVSGATAELVAAYLPGGGTGLGGVFRTGVAELVQGRASQLVTNVVSGQDPLTDMFVPWQIAADVVPGVTIASLRTARAAWATRRLGHLDDVTASRLRNLDRFTGGKRSLRSRVQDLFPGACGRRLRGGLSVEEFHNRLTRPNGLGALRRRLVELNEWVDQLTRYGDAGDLLSIPRSRLGFSGEAAGDASGKLIWVRKSLGIPERGKPNSLVSKIRDWAYGYNLDPENYKQWATSAGEGGIVLGRDGEVLPNGWYMYVVDKNNTVRYLPTDPTPTSNKPFEQYRAHTQLAGGENVWGAGTFEIVEGKFKILDTGSGHYRPSPKYLDYVKAVLEMQGFGVTSTDFQAFRPLRPWYHPKELQRLGRDFGGAIVAGMQRLLGRNVQEQRPVPPPDLEELMPY